MGTFLTLIFIGSLILCFLSKQANIYSNRSYDQEQQRIAKKYGGTGYPTVHLMRHQTTPEVWAKYCSEIDELSKRHGYS